MKICEQNIDIVTTLFNGPARVLKYFCIGPVENIIGNDYLNSNIYDIFYENTLITENENVLLTNGTSCKSFYYESNDIYKVELSFTKYSFKENERMFAFANIRCTENKKAVLRIGRTGKFKVWVNNVLIYNQSPIWADSYFVLLELNKGDNTVCFELCHPSIISLKLDEYMEGVGITDELLLKDYFYNEIYKNVAVIQKENDISNLLTHEFMVIPRDFIHISNKKLRIVVKNEDGDVCDCFEALLGEKIRYGINKASIELMENSFLKFEIIYNDFYGNEFRIENILLYDINKHRVEIDNIMNRYIHIRNTNNLTDEDVVNIEGRIRDLDLKDYQKVNGSFFITISKYFEFIINEKKNIYHILNYIQDGLHFSHYLGYENLKGNSLTVYFRSSLDNAMSYYIIHIPQYYDSHKKYALVLLPATDIMAQEIHEKKIRELGRKDVIVATISTRGVTTGSYIGEAAILESLNDIFARFHIDEDRVYLCGYSNGAYATWALAQAYPHLFAAIAPIAGIPYCNNLSNLSNLAVLNICGDKDFIRKKAFDIPSETLLSLNTCYKSILIQDAIHLTILPHYYSGYAIDWMLQFKRNKYPKKIMYRTERILHNRSYWLKIMQMIDEARHCEVEGEIVDYSNIKIKLFNVRSFAIEIPDYLNKDRINIRINDNGYFTFNNLKKKDLFFEKDGESCYLTSSENKNKTVISSRGMGILDIYMNGFKVVIPSLNIFINKREILEEAAKNLASPKTSGYDNVVIVNNLIYNEDEISFETIKNSNLILIGAEKENKWISYFRGELSLEFLSDGYEYKGKFYKGNYCIAMIHTNPLNSNKKILFYYSNQYELIRKNILSRMIVLPSYSNGLHPLLNNEVIIFDGKSYSAIYALGDEIKKVL